MLVNDDIPQISEPDSGLRLVNYLNSATRFLARGRNRLASRISSEIADVAWAAEDRVSAGEYAAIDVKLEELTRSSLRALGDVRRKILEDAERLDQVHSVLRTWSQHHHGGGPMTFDASTNYHFHGGQFHGCSIGDNNSIENFASHVAASSLGADAKDGLVNARAQLEQLVEGTQTQQEVVSALISLLIELKAETPDRSRVRDIFTTINSMAPIVAETLRAVNTIGKLIGG